MSERVPMFIYTQEQLDIAVRAAEQRVLDEARRAVLKLHYIDPHEHACTCEEECYTIDAAAGRVEKMIDALRKRQIAAELTRLGQEQA